MNNKLDIDNAEITSTHLGFEDHGFLTFYITLEWDGGGQGLGGYLLVKDHVGFGLGLVAISEILETVGVNSWEKLKGTLVRVKHGQLGSDRKPIIGHILKDRWFDLQEFMTLK